MDIDKMKDLIADLKNDIIVAIEEKLDKKLENTLDKLCSSVKNNETAITEIEDNQKINTGKIAEIEARVNVENETLVDNTERIDKLDRDMKLAELRMKEVESQMTEMTLNNTDKIRMDNMGKKIKK